jgi:hypothetical protein
VESVGGHASYPATLQLSCEAAACTGTLALDAGTTFDATWDGTTLSLSLDLTQTIANHDAKGKPLRGSFTQHQRSHGSLAGSGGSTATPLAGTVADRSVITAVTGSNPITDRGPFVRKEHVTLRSGAKQPSTRAAPSPTTPPSSPASGQTAPSSSTSPLTEATGGT